MVEGKNLSIENSNGVKLSVLTLGASIQKLIIPVKGKFLDIVQGYDTQEEYLDGQVYYGGLIGRFSNRISNARFSLDGKEYTLTENRPGICIHGGKVGFNKKEFTILKSSKQSISLELLSEDNEEGFPGAVKVLVEYSLTEDNELHLKYTAETTKPTVLNLTNHSYFNLSGHSAKDIYNHYLEVPSDEYLDKRDNACPSGAVLECKGMLDYTESTRIGDRIEEYKSDKGLDHSFLVRDWDPKTKSLRKCAVIKDPDSGITLEVLTDQSTCHVYTANYLSGVMGKEGAVHHKHSAICIETQGYPDSPNIISFPSSTLRPGEVYRHHTVWKFSGFS